MGSLPAEPSTAPGIETATAGATAVFTVTVSLACALYPFRQSRKQRFLKAQPSLRCWKVKITDSLRIRPA